MSQYLTTISETYRVDSEKEAAKVIEEAKNDNRFTLMKSSTTYKHYNETKNREEEEFWVVTLQKKFNELREPDCTVSVSYEIVDGAFPSPRDTVDEEETFPFSEDTVSEDEE